MKLYTAAQMRAIDQTAAARGLPTGELMARAGQAVATEAVALLGAEAAGRRVLLLCGRGNNGGDGFAAARLLAERGAAPVVALAGAAEQVQGAARSYLQAAREAGVPVLEVTDQPDRLPQVEQEARNADLIIDALLGTGISGEVGGVTADLIGLCNRVSAERRVPVLAVDVPSGIDADTGQVAGTAVRATATVTMVGAKLGLALYPGAEHAGRVSVSDLGVPPEILAATQAEAELLDPSLAREWLPARPPDSHKGDFGTVLVVAGAAGMTGAAWLAAQGALRAGAGLVRVATASSLQDILAIKGTEFMTAPLPQTIERTIAADAVAEARRLAEASTVMVLGPGLSRHAETAHFVRSLIPALARPLVLDADGLNALAGHAELLQARTSATVITPHPGEMARLLGCPATQVQADRVGAVRAAARELGCIALLKGARTVVADPEGRLLVNPTGNPGMASGGTGDVLAGMIGALLAQGMPPLQAAGLAAYLHGLAGDLAAAHLTCYGMIAGDLLISLPAAFRAVLEGSTAPLFASARA